MNARVLGLTAIVAVLLVVGALSLLLATGRVQQTGTAAGVRYDFTHTGFRGYSLVTTPTGFRYEQRPWFGLGRPNLEVAVEKGRLSINQVDCGPVAAGQQLRITADRRILVDDNESVP